MPEDENLKSLLVQVLKSLELQQILVDPNRELDNHESGYSMYCSFYSLQMH
jgi:hypothetical protein